MFLKSKFPDSIMSHLPVELNATECEIVAATAVLAHLHYSEVSEATASHVIVDSLINTPCTGGPLTLQLFLLLLHLLVVVNVIWQVDSAIQHCPVYLIITCLEMPVHEDMRGWISVLETVASGDQVSALAQVNSKEWKWLVKRSAVDNLSPCYVFNLAPANGWGEAVNQTESVWVLPRSLHSISP